MPEGVGPARGPELAMRLRRSAWRAWYRARWVIWQQREVDQLRIRRVAGVDLVVLPGVLDPALFLSSEILALALADQVRPGDAVLDVGTGCGIGAIVAAGVGASRVVATDVDPLARRCASTNVALHGLVERVSVVEGDLFEPVGQECFDVVAFNPPYLSSPAPAGLDRAMRAPSGLGDRFAAGLGAHLRPGGRALLVLSTNGRPEDYLQPLRDGGYTLTRGTQRDRGSEVLTAWSAAPRA